MDKFIVKKSYKANIYKSIRFPVDVNDKINKIIDEYNKGLDKKEYSFNGFVISACEYALENMKKDK